MTDPTQDVLTTNLRIAELELGVFSPRNEADVLTMRINQMQGRRLSQLEEALHVKKMVDRYGYTQERMAKLYSRSQQWVKIQLRLDLEGELAEKFNEYKRRKGLVNNTDVVRLMINEIYENMIKEEA